MFIFFFISKRKWHLNLIFLGEIDFYKTRMHSSRMRTGRALTVSRGGMPAWRGVPAGGVPAGGGRSACLGGCLPRGRVPARGVPADGCLPRGGACPGGCLPRGVACPGGCLPGGCLPGGVSARGVSAGGVLDQAPPRKFGGTPP